MSHLGLCNQKQSFVVLFDDQYWMKAIIYLIFLKFRNTCALYNASVLIVCKAFLLICQAINVLQVFKFGSVPLKTYLPDGDIDLTAFSHHQELRDTWASDVQTVLEYEEQRKDAECRVSKVQCIHAEVTNFLTFIIVHFSVLWAFLVTLSYRLL